MRRIRHVLVLVLLALFASPLAAQVDFLRGDCTGNGAVDLNDVLYMFCLFCDPAPPCLDACDVDDDQNFDLVDGVFLISHLFAGGPPPLAPFPACGPDPTPDTLGCLFYNCLAVPQPPAVDANYIFSLESVAGSPGETVRVPVLLEVGPNGAGTWSFGVAHDPALLELIDVELGGAVINPAYHEFQSLPAGWTLVTFLTLIAGQELLDPGVHEVAAAHYLVLGAVGETTALEFVEDLGVPEVTVRVSYSIFAVAPLTSGGSVEITTAFRRGDVNQDGVIDIADPVFDLNCLFLCFPVCPDAHDANDDGNWNIADPIFTLGHLFLGTGPLPPPFAECGADPTPDAMACAAYGGCP